MHKIDQGNYTGVMNNNAYFADNFKISTMTDQN